VEPSLALLRPTPAALASLGGLRKPLLSASIEGAYRALAALATSAPRSNANADTPPVAIEVPKRLLLLLLLLLLLILQAGSWIAILPISPHSEARLFLAAVTLGDRPLRLEARFVVRTNGMGLLLGLCCGEGPESGGRDAVRGAARGNDDSHSIFDSGSGSCRGGGPSSRMLQGAEEARGAIGTCGASTMPTSPSTSSNDLALPLLAGAGTDAGGTMVRCAAAASPWKSSAAVARVKFAASSFNLGGCGAAGATVTEGKQSTGKGSSPGGASRGRKRRAKALRPEGGAKVCAVGNFGPSSSPTTSMAPKPSVPPLRALSKRSHA